jgi:hypothetical protein
MEELQWSKLPFVIRSEAFVVDGRKARVFNEVDPTAIPGL